MTPQAEKIHKKFTALGESVSNDHVAFRTFANTPLSLDVLEKHFFSLGYKRFEPYQFKEKKLDAFSYLPPSPDQPRIFLSELRIKDLSTTAQTTLAPYIHSIEKSAANDIACLWQGRCWSTPTVEDYQTLLQESEYAAWLLVHGLCANHFTISVNQLKNDDLNWVNNVVEDLGFEINSADGKIKGSPAVLLEQSATKADHMAMNFTGGKHLDVSTCYYEFAKRYADANGKLYEGFVAASADKIFESTDMKK